MDTDTDVVQRKTLSIWRRLCENDFTWSKSLSRPYASCLARERP